METCVENENDYWTALSEGYRIKVKALARNHNMDTRAVMRNLEGYLKTETLRMKKPGVDCSHHSFTTMREMEALIDTISLRG